MPLIVPREIVYEALFAKTAGVTWDIVPGDNAAQRTFINRSRRVKLFSDVQPAQQPAIYQAEHEEVIAQRTNLPYRRVFKANWIVYQRTGSNKSIAGAIENNQILDALQLALEPVPGDDGYPNRQSLGGLVHHCYIEGAIFKDPGDIDDQGMMVVPITMLVP